MRARFANAHPEFKGPFPLEITGLKTDYFGRFRLFLNLNANIFEVKQNTNSRKTSLEITKGPL